MKPFRKTSRILQNIIFMTLLGLFPGITVMSGQAMAHQGHAGNQVVFLKKEEALKQMLPAGAKIVQRKEILDTGKAEKAKKEYGVKLNEGVYAYYMASDRKSGEVMGAAMVTNVEYMHGEAYLAIGIDAKGNVTKAAILSVNEKYLSDMRTSVGTGYLSQLEGITVKKLLVKADAVTDSSPAAKKIFSQLRDMAALLSTFVTASLVTR